jgi:hypothetical protein
MGNIYSLHAWYTSTYWLVALKWKPITQELHLTKKSQDYENFAQDMVNKNLGIIWK